MSALDVPGLDTWLARLLLQQRRLPAETVRAQLAEVHRLRSQGAPATLANTLVGQGLLADAEAATLVGGLVAQTARRGWRPGARVGEHVLVAPLGAGGMGTVWRAQHVATGAPRAIKALVGGTADPALRARFTREGVAQAALSTHPNVVAVHAAGEAWGVPFLALELVEGGSLEDRLRAGPLAIDEAARTVEALAAGLAHTHALGILHRDLKPANVLYDAAGTPKLADFGLAAVVGEATLTQTGEVLGTPAYMAPEQARGDRRQIGPATDVYGLGALLYHALTGQPPFGGKGLLATLHDVANRPPTAPSKLRPDLPRSLEAVCLRALAKDPADRYPTAQAFADDLARFQRGELTGRRRTSTGVRAAAGLSAVAILVAAVAVAIRDEPGPAAGAAPEVASPADPAGGSPAPAADATDPNPPADPGAPHRVLSLGALLATPEPDAYPGATEAFVVQLEAARRQDPTAAYHVARALSGANHQRTVEQNQPEASRWFFRAARWGNVDGFRRVGLRLWHGQGVTPDLAAAVDWLLQAASRGDDDAQESLDELYRTHPLLKEGGRVTLAKLLAAPPAESLGPAFEADVRAFHQAGDPRAAAAAAVRIGDLLTGGAGTPAGRREVHCAAGWYFAAAARGDPAGMEALANLLDGAGDVLRRDVDAARAWRARAAAVEAPAEQAGGGSDELPTLAQILARAVPAHYAGATELFEEFHLASARKGEAVAMYRVARSLEGANGEALVDPDPSEANRWYALAAMAGHGEAARRLALNLWSGEGGGVAVDVDAAASWLELAQSAGDPNAVAAMRRLSADRAPRARPASGDPPEAQSLAWVLADPPPVRVSKSLAGFVAAYDAAADDASAGQAAALLGHLYAGSQGSNLVAPDLGHAVRWFFRGAQHGDASCMAALAHLLGEENGAVAVDRPASQSWWRRAAAGGNPEAQAVVGRRLIRGEGPDRDVPQGIDLLERATKAGRADAMLALVDCHLEGLGVETNVVHAISLLRRAAETGSLEAELRLAALVTRTDVDARRPPTAREAVEALGEAAAAADPSTLYLLGAAYRDGVGVVRDAALARRYLVRAAEGGDPRALRAVELLPPVKPQ